MMVLTPTLTPTAVPRPMAAPRPVGKVPAPMPLPKRGSIRSRGYKKPNKLGIGRLVITKMAPGKFELLESEEPRKCYGNQVGCILRECASINDDDLRSKEHLTQLLLTKLHKRFKFPDRDDNIEQPWDDPKMKKINNNATGMFSNDLASWKGR